MAAVNFLRCRALLVLLIAGLLPLALRAASAPAGESTDRIIVKWRDAPNPSRIPDVMVQRLESRLGNRMAPGRTIGGGMSVLRLDRRRGGSELQAVLASLRADPDIEAAEPDGRVRAHEYLPNDPGFTTGQWYLKGTQTAALRATTAWDVSRGGPTPANSVIVAVIDTGVRFDHPDLAGKLLPGYDFISAPPTSGDGDTWDADASDNGDFLTAEELASDFFRNGNCGGGTAHNLPTASSWHGTRVSGIIAAQADNAQGIAGTGFNLRVLPARALGKCGGFDSDVLAAMYWAAGLTVPPALLFTTDLPVNTTPAQIINMSLGSSSPCNSMYATAVNDVTAHGVLIVASVGNDGKAVGSPANCTGVLGVAGVRHAGTKVGYSALGARASIAAPAGNCVNLNPGEPCLFQLDTTTNDGLQGPGNNIYTDQYLRPNYGTSFASPQAAAVAGLMKAVNPALGPAAIISRIRSTARPFPSTSDTTPQPPVCQTPTTGLVQDYECICTTSVCGAGLLYAAGAVNEALRPAAVAGVVGAVSSRATVTLDGSHSGVSTGRSAAYQWTVVSTADGADTPAIQDPTQAVTSVTAPATGSAVLRLTVTDNTGASDTADVTLTIVGQGGSGSSTSPPATTDTNGEGGGALSWPLLLLLSAGAAYTLRRRIPVSKAQAWTPFRR